MLLQKGSKGDDVKKLQSRLIELGYICGTGTADGIYGNGTYNSVKDFQRLKGLSVDGIAGPDTLTTLYSADPERYEFIPETGDIAGYAVNAISRWEGNYTSINPREPISIGILQWYQERAHDLLRSIREQDARLVENILGKDSVYAIYKGHPGGEAVHIAADRGRTGKACLCRRPPDVCCGDGKSGMREVHHGKDAGRKAWKGKIPAVIPVRFETDAGMAVCRAFRSAGPGAALFQRGFQTAAAERDPDGQYRTEKESGMRAGRSAPVGEGYAGRTEVPAELQV